MLRGGKKIVFGTWKEPYPNRPIPPTRPGFAVALIFRAVLFNSCDHSLDDANPNVYTCSHSRRFALAWVGVVPEPRARQSVCESQ